MVSVPTVGVRNTIDQPAGASGRLNKFPRRLANVAPDVTLRSGVHSV